MFPHPPVVVGLTIAQDIRYHSNSGNYSVIEAFNGLSGERFPLSVSPFAVLVTLTDAEGEGRLELVVTKLDDPMVEARRIYRTVRFKDRLQLLACVIRVERCIFPSPGVYLLTLSIDGEWLAHRSLFLSVRETRS